MLLLFTAQLCASHHVTCLHLPRWRVLKKMEYYASLLERQGSTLEQMCHLFYQKRATVSCTAFTPFTVKYQIIAILIGIYLFQSLNRPGVYLGLGGNLGQAFNSLVVRLLQVKLLWRRKQFSQPALVANSLSLLSLTVAYICFAITLIILQDTLSWRAGLLITHYHMFISSSLLAFFLPPPGSLALLLSSLDRP